MAVITEKDSIGDSSQFSSLQRSAKMFGLKRDCSLCCLASLCKRMMEALSFVDEDQLSSKTSHE